MLRYAKLINKAKLTCSISTFLTRTSVRGKILVAGISSVCRHLKTWLAEVLPSSAGSSQGYFRTAGFLFL